MSWPNRIQKAFCTFVLVIAVLIYSNVLAETIPSIRTDIGEAWHIRKMADSTANYVVLKSYQYTTPIKISVALARVIEDAFDKVSRAAELDARLL